jgi:hypothetical protein
LPLHVPVPSNRKAVNDGGGLAREATRMHIKEFKDWLFALDVKTAGQPPDLAQWRELKARLEAVTGEVASSPASPEPAPAIPAAPSASQRAQPETAVADMDPPDAADPEPGDFRALSREKDGGLAAHAVDVLRGRA